MSDPSIEVVGLSKRFKLYTERRNSMRELFVRGSGSKYDEFWALRDINLEVQHGTTFGLVGHNGSGKSTLLKMMAGIHRPTRGSVIARGRISALLELGAGFHNELTGRENIYLNGAILGLSRRQIDSAMDEIIDFAGIRDFIDSPVKVYSSGMTVRLGFSIAVTVDPEILLVDEIIAVGDEEFQRKCMDHLFTLRRKGTTIVLVSHSLSVMRELCDHGVWIDHGSQRMDGEIGEVVDGYLEAVNQKESEGNQSSVTGDGTGDGSVVVLGSGEVRVTKLAYLDGDGNPVSFATSGSPVTFRIHYAARQYIEKVEFSIGLVHETGVHVAEPSSKFENRVFTLEPGSGFVDFDVYPLTLQPGMFLITTAITHRGHVYDHQPHKFELRIRSGQGGTESGLVRMPGKWSHHHGA